jgi:hypothetical protein
VPSPQPPGHKLAFIPGYQTPDDVSLASAWYIEGPLNDARLCLVQVLDCGSDAPCNGTVWGKNCSIYPNPRDPLHHPAVACPSNATVAHPPVLRVYYGANCPLWQPNALNCSWDNIKQSFKGGACVPSPSGSTECMCRHLTDFASARAPKVNMCSASDMSSLSMADILTKLRFLFIVVIILFATMHVGAFLGIIMDVSSKRDTIARIRTPAAGFEETANGTWTWGLYQAPLEKAVDAPQGSAIELSAVLAFPFARLRVALPAEMLQGSVAQCLGLKSGLSAKGMQDCAEAMSAVHATLSKGFFSLFGDDGNKRIPELHLERSADGDCGEFLSAMRHRLAPIADEAGSHPSPERMVGTALTLAHLANQRAMNIVELGERRAAASSYFRGVKIPGIDHDFEKLLGFFMLMLGDDAGALTPRKSWLVTARLWRFVLLQQSDGSWDASTSLAFALGAHDGPLPPPQTSWFGRLKALVSKLDDLEADEVSEGDAGPLVAGDEGGEEAAVHDCPLTFQRSAIIRRMPPELAKFPDCQKVWATLLAMRWLEKAPVSWLTSEEEAPETTLVDSARCYLIERCKADRKLRRIFKGGLPIAAADKSLRIWQKAREHAVHRARIHDGVSKHRGLHMTQRAISRILKSCQTDHDTISVLLDANSFIMRWQRFMILMVRLFFCSQQA